MLKYLREDRVPRLKDQRTEAILKMKPEKLVHTIKSDLDVFTAKWIKVERYLLDMLPICCLTKTMVDVLILSG